MSKRSLMLSAAAVALLSSPALAAGPTTISTVVTTSKKTSDTGDLTITSAGGITFKSATVPMLTLDSSNFINNGGVLSGADQTTETGIVIDASGISGSLTNNGAINLGGTGTGKIGVYLQGASTFTGNIDLDTGSVVTIVGDSSTGILTDATSTLNGDLLLGGTLTMQPTTANETASSTITIANLQGTIKGNVIVGAGAVYSAVGNGAQGINILGQIKACDNTLATCIAGGEIGTFSNSGTISVGGVLTRSTTAPNAESGSALIIGNSIAGGILNNGPVNQADSTAAASISANGVNTATIEITPEALAPIEIGTDSVDANGGYSFINRGSITAAPADPNKSVRAIVIAGSSSALNVKFDGLGFFNSGTVIAQATSIDPGTPVAARAIEIDSFVTLPGIYISAQSTTVNANNGVIESAISGPQGGVATGIIIGGTNLNALDTTISVPTITLEAGARLIVTASVTDPTKAGVTTLAAIGIEDRSNSLTTINNAGVISATASTLANGSTSTAVAVDASLNTTALNFTNNGSVTGDVLFGSGNDTYTVVGSGLGAASASHTGAINFGFSSGAGGDTLTVGQFANVAGAITAQGNLDVHVDGGGTLSVENVITTAGTNMQTRTLTVAGAPTAVGTLNITVTQGVTAIPVISVSQQATFGLGANLNVQYGSFINTAGTFDLISTPLGHLAIDASDVARYNAQVGGGPSGHLPFLFESASIVLTPDDGAGHEVLQLIVQPKTVAQLGLTGYAKALFPIANIAIASDAALGAAMIAGINSPTDAQKAYDAFAPDVSGGERAIAISLTDQGTGVVAARQRALRLFGKQPGDLTLWGNEFGEYISNQGGTTTQPGGTITGAEPGFKDHGFGFSLGLDEGSAANGWYGAAFTFYTGDVSEGGDRTSKTNSLWYMLTAYSDWRGKGLFLDSQLTVGYANFKGKRTLVLQIPPSATSPGVTTFGREADSKSAGLLASLGMTLGAMLKAGPATFIPQISLDGMAMRQEGYTEINGGSGFDLAVKPYYANSLRVFLGSEFRGDLDLGDFYLQPSARLGYRFDFLNDPEKLKAQFANINPSGVATPGQLFTLQGPDPSRGNYVAGLNLAATTENWTVGLNYDFVRGSHNETEQVGTISLLGRI